MEKDIFIENVKARCAVMGISPSAACRDSGAGRSLLDNIKRDRAPSIDSVQKLARHLGVTTSQLLGEVALPSADGMDLYQGSILTYDSSQRKIVEVSWEEFRFLSAFQAADSRAKSMVALALEPWLQSGKKDGKAM